MPRTPRLGTSGAQDTTARNIWYPGHLGLLISLSRLINNNKKKCQKKISSKKEQIAIICSIITLV